MPLVIGGSEPPTQIGMMQIALISDTHLTPTAPAFDANLAAARGWIAAHGIAETIHLGDITADGVVDEAQLDHARSFLAGWPGTLRVLPGNHDIGDNPGPYAHPEVNGERLARYVDRFGADRWSERVGAWTLIGLNAQILGQGSTFEQAQNAWLDDTLASGVGPIGLFLHKPLFRDGAKDRSTHHRYVPHDARDALLQRLGDRLRFVVSGHTHQTRNLHVDGIEHRWVPSSAFILPDAMQETIGEKDIGIAVLTLQDESFRFDLVRPEGMTRHNLIDHAEVYPEYTETLKAMARDAGR